MKKNIYIILILNFILFALLSLNNFTYAAYTKGTSTSDGIEPSSSGQSTGSSSSSLDLDSMKSDADSFISNGKSNQKITTGDVKKEVLSIANILVGVASIVFVVVGSILGVQYMMGTPDKKSELKQKLIWFIVAIVLVYGAVGIYNIIVRIMENIVQ